MKGMMERDSKPRDLITEWDRAVSSGRWGESDMLELEVASVDKTLVGLWAAYERMSQSVEAVVELRSTVEDLNGTLHAKNDHIASLEDAIARLEGELASKQATLDERTDLLERVESGKVLRLLNRLTNNQ